MLGDIFNPPSDAWRNVVKHDKATVLGEKCIFNCAGDQSMYVRPNKYKFDIEKFSPTLNILEGSIKKACKIHNIICELSKDWFISEQYNYFIIPSYNISKIGKKVVILQLI
jgi:hypothetical protein